MKSPVQIPLICPYCTKSDLHRDGNNVWASGPNMLRLFGPLNLSKCHFGLSSWWKFLVMLGNLLSKCLVLGTLLLIILKFIGGARDFALHSVSSLTFLRISDGSQEIPGSLARWMIPAHSGKIFYCIAAWTKVNLPSFVQNSDLIEDVVNRLRRLIYGNGMSRTGKVGRDP